MLFALLQIGLHKHVNCRQVVQKCVTNFSKLKFCFEFVWETKTRHKFWIIVKHDEGWGTVSWNRSLPATSDGLRHTWETDRYCTVLVGGAHMMWYYIFNWINQPDPANSQVYYLSFKYSSTCSGHPHAHHQKLHQLQLLMMGMRMPETCWAVFK